MTCNNFIPLKQQSCKKKTAINTYLYLPSDCHHKLCFTSPLLYILTSERANGVRSTPSLVKIYNTPPPNQFQALVITNISTVKVINKMTILRFDCIGPTIHSRLGMNKIGLTSWNLVSIISNKRVSVSATFEALVSIWNICLLWTSK